MEAETIDRRLRNLAACYEGLRFVWVWEIVVNRIHEEAWLVCPEMKELIDDWDD